MFIGAVVIVNRRYTPFGVHMAALHFVLPANTLMLDDLAEATAAKK